MPAVSPILIPLLALVCWTWVIWMWMYATRIPAIMRAGMKLDPEAVNGVQMSQLPARTRWKADNYNHLMEQPTLFYAIALSLALMQHDGLGVTLAWIYVFLRIVHSLVQTLSNRIELRFGVFALSSFVLMGMTACALLALRNAPLCAHIP